MDVREGLEAARPVGRDPLLIGAAAAALAAAAGRALGDPGAQAPSPFPLRIVKTVAPVSSPAFREHVAFCRDLGFNGFWVYSHAAGRWTSRAAPHGPFLFPEFREFARSARARGLRVVVSINPVADPGSRFVFSEPEGERRIRKFIGLLRKAGVRDFVLSFDDQPTELHELRDLMRYGRSAAPAHLDLASRIERAVRAGETLWLCASAYCDAHLDDEADPYARAFLAGLPSLPRRVGIVWTGPEVVSPAIRLDDLRRTRARLGGRQILLYDNYPTNGDGPVEALALVLGPLRNRDPSLHEEVAAYLSCPMTQLGASRLPLMTVADYLRDPGRYDPDRSWLEAIRTLAGPDPEALDALKTQALEWGGWIGTLNYHPHWLLNPRRVAAFLHDPAFVASFEWTVSRYPERMERLARVRDALFRDELLELMARRLAVARALPVVVEALARHRAGREDLDELLEVLSRQRESVSRWPSAQRVLDRFLAAAGVTLPRAETPAAAP